jgi:hypothetical protein
MPDGSTVGVDEAPRPVVPDAAAGPHRAVREIGQAGGGQADPAAGLVGDFGDALVAGAGVAGAGVGVTVMLL